MSGVKKRRSGGNNSESDIIAEPSAKPTKTVPISGSHQYYYSVRACVFLAVAVAVCAAGPRAINFVTNANEPDRSPALSGNEERNQAIAFYFFETIADWNINHAKMYAPADERNAVKIISGMDTNDKLAQERIEMLKTQFDELSKKNQLFIIEDDFAYQNTAERFTSLLKKVDLLTYFVSVTAWKRNGQTQLQKINEIITNNNLQKSKFYLITSNDRRKTFLKDNGFNVIKVNKLMGAKDFDEIRRGVN